MKRLNGIGRFTLICAAVIVAIVVVLRLLDALPRCETGDNGIGVGHMLVEGCK